MSVRNIPLTSAIAAFVASYGSGAPVIGILAEYDALPGISQDAVPQRKPVGERPPPLDYRR